MNVPFKFRLIRNFQSPWLIGGFSDPSIGTTVRRRSLHWNPREKTSRSHSNSNF